MMTNPVTLWHGPLDLYRTAQRAANRAPGTVKLHRSYLMRLAEAHPDPWAVRTDDLLEFLAVERWEAETRRSATTVVRGFYRWAHGTGRIDVDPGQGVPPVKAPSGQPRPAPEFLVFRLATSEDRRLAFMAMLGAVAALRPGEISAVHGDDLVDGVLFVKGKGSKVRAVPIVDPILLAMLEGVGSAWAFPSRGRPGKHLTPGHVGKVLSKAMGRTWTGHKLRHRAATVALEGSGGDLLAVMEFLGHSRPETTIRYTLGSKAKLRRCAAATALDLDAAA